MNMTRTDINNSYKLCPRQSKTTKIAVMRQNDTASLCRLLQNLNVRKPIFPLLGNRFNIHTSFPQKQNNIGVNIFIRKQREIKRFHVPILTSNSTSFFTDCAAYLNASSTASGVN